MIQAVIFDCFGVVISDALAVLMSEVELEDPAKARQIHDIIYASNHGLTSPRDSGQEVADLLGISYEEYRQLISSGEVKDQTLMGYIRDLRASYKTALLSNIGSGSLARRFTDNELLTHFDVVVASGDIGHTKPEPEAYQITAERLSVLPEHCVFIDDREGYCEGARSIGMRTITYRSFPEFRRQLETLLAKG